MDFATPKFSGKLRTAAYYDNIASIINSMRSTFSLRKMADKLNADNYTTPAGKPFTRSLVANFIRHNINKKEA